MAGIVYHGIDYAAARALLDIEAPAQRRKLFRQIRLLEMGALSVINGKDVSDNAAYPR